MSKRFYEAIGMAKRAGVLSLGEYAVKQSARTGDAKFVVIAADASRGTKKSIKNSCEYYRIRYIEYGEKERLGASLGKGECSAASINDDNFAKAVYNKYKSISLPGKDD